MAFSGEGADLTLHSSPVRSYFAAPAILFVVFVLAYAGSIQRPLRGDSVWYAHEILMPRAELFHPHHLLYNPLMRTLWLPFSTVARGAEGSLLYLRGVNTIISALVPALFCLAAMRWGAGVLWAFGIALAFGLFGTSFTLSSQIEVYSSTILFLCLTMLGLALHARSFLGRSLVVGGYTAAMLFHQTALLFGSVIVMSEAASRRRDGGSLPARLGVCLGLPLLLVGLVYVGVAWHLGIGGPAEFWKWLTTQVQTGYWGKGDLSAGTFQTAKRTFYKALLVSSPHTIGWETAVCFGLVLCFLILMSRGRESLRHPMVAAGLSIWMVALAAFSAWWDAAGAEFWGMVFLPGCFVLSLATPAFASADAPSRRLPLLLAGACLVMSVVLLELADLAIPLIRADPDERVLAAKALTRVAHDGDLVLAADTGGSTYYRLYLQNPRITVLSISVKPAHEATSAMEGTFTSTLLDWVERRTRSVAAQGAHCWVDRLLLEGRLATARLMRDLDVQEFTTGLRVRFEAVPVSDRDPALIYELRPASTAP